MHQFIRGELREVPLETLALSFATSIDAFAAGVGLSLVEFDVLGPAITAGISSFLLTLAGSYIGFKGKAALGRKSGHLEVLC